MPTHADRHVGGDAMLRESAPLVRAVGQGRLFCVHRGAHVRTRPTIQTRGIVYTDGETMAKAIVTTRSATARRPRRSSIRSGWVRKNVIMDQRKLDVVRRALGVDTETEAIDQALDLVAFGEELANGFRSVRRSGGIEDVFERRRA